MERSANRTYKSSIDRTPKSVMDVAGIPKVSPLEISSSERSAMVPAQKPRKKPMTSLYLKFFETALDGRSRTCKICGQTYSMSTATGNLGKHLNNRHPGYDKFRDTVASKFPQPSTDSTQPRTASTRKHQLDTKPPKMDLDHLNWLLIKWLASSSLPPAILEEKWLVSSFRYVNPSAQIWSGQKFQDVVGDVFKSMQDDLKATLDQVASKVSIALEFWTSYQQLHYMSITCQWVDDNWSIQQLLLDICRIPYPYSGGEIYSALVKVLKKYNIDDKVIACTHDNSQAAMHACHSLERGMDAHKGGLFFNIPCAVRTLNMIVEDALRTIKPLILKVREFILALNASSELSKEFAQYATAYQEGSWRTPFDASARWSGYYQTLDLVHKGSKSMDAVIRKHEESLGSRLLLDTTEKNLMNIMHGYLEPFYMAINDLCASKFLTVGMVLLFMDHICEKIDAYKGSHHTEWLKNDAEEMAKKARSYNGQVYDAFTYMSAVLDPRIKADLIPGPLNLESNLEQARTFFAGYLFNDHFPSGTGIYDHHERESCSISFAEEIARKKRRVNMIGADELTQYLSEPSAPIHTDSLEWWKGNSTRYPRLAVMAKDFLAVHATSVVPKELFCNIGDEIEKQRHCLSSDSMQAILCIKSWTESGLKLKYRSTEIDYDMLMELASNAAADETQKS